MPLSDVPREILLSIADQLDIKGINSLCLTNSQLYNLLNEYLYRRDITQSEGPSRSLLWAATSKELPLSSSTAQRALEAGRHLDPIPECYHDALQMAADEGHVGMVKLLLKVDGINPNFAGGLLQSPPLVIAAEMGHSGVVELLLAAANIDPNARDQYSGSPLLYACRQRHVSIVKQLLDRDDIDLNAVGLGLSETPLLIACREWRGEEVANMLLKKAGINVNVTNINGDTPLMLAAQSEKVSVVESLLARDDMDPIILNAFNNLGDHVLRSLVCQGNITIVKLLLSCPDIDVNFTAPGSHSALMLACKVGAADMVRLLLDKDDILINQQDFDGFTPLCHAASFAYLNDGYTEGHVDAIMLLLQRDDIELNLPDNSGCTPLLWACSSLYLPVVDLFLKQDGIDPNVRSSNGYTPLAYTCLRPINVRAGVSSDYRRKFVAVVQSLLSHRDIDPNPVNNGVSLLDEVMEKFTPLYGEEIESLLRHKLSEGAN